MSTTNKVSPMGEEEQVARTATIGAAKPWKEFGDTTQLVSQHTLLIRKTLPIDDGLDFPISEKVVDMPVKPLYTFEVAI